MSGPCTYADCMDTRTAHRVAEAIALSVALLLALAALYCATHR